MSSVLDAAPSFGSSVVWLWEAFQELSKTRVMGFSSFNGISYQEIESYCSIYEIYGDDARLLARVVLKLDGVWLRWSREKKPEPEEDKDSGSESTS